jgi:thiamine-monophosphate kinase
VSDGLSSELWEIAEASGVSIVVDAPRIPLADVMRQYAAAVGKSALDWALYGGEDYELVGTVAAAEAERIGHIFHEQGCSFHVIGRVEEGEASLWLSEEQGKRRPLPKAGYNHFSR